MRALLFLMLVLCTAVLSACSTAQNTVVQRLFWPPLPDRPRIEWIKQYRSQLDIEKTGLQRFTSSITGENKPISLLKPIEVKSDSTSRRVFVSDVGSANVFVFDELRHELRTLNGSDPDIRYPLSIALDADGFIYVLDRRVSAIIIFDKDEKFVRTIYLEPRISKPLAMCLDVRNNRIIVSEGSSHKVHVLDLKGNLLFNFGGFGETTGSFNLPIAVTVNSESDIIVADSFNARIQIFNKSGTYKRTFGTRGDAPGEFQLIKSVAVDSDNNIYVVDGKGHNVQIFSAQGDLLLVLGGFYSVAGTGKIAQAGFAVPVAIDIDAADMIFIADQLNSRVQVFRYLSDKFLRENPIAGFTPTAPVSQP